MPDAAASRKRQIAERSGWNGPALAHRSISDASDGAAPRCLCADCDGAVSQSVHEIRFVPGK
jgi:hypothetical protein